MTRTDGRACDEIRPVSFERGYTRYAEGSVLSTFGNTKVLCTATVEDRVPPFLKGTGSGWVTAEYAMLPRATSTRTARSTRQGGQDGRSMEIQRLVGRVLRSCVVLDALGERTITLDCDVIQADGGTRTAAVSGSFVALVDALRTMRDRGIFPHLPIRFLVSAVSVGKVQGIAMVDLCYEEDSIAEVDMNLVMNHNGDYIEVQGTGEKNIFTPVDLQVLLALGLSGTVAITALQREALGFVKGELPDL
ncbi:MAG TPA: ribonuclease PH [Synergistaceae bacterium]|nr:ribonuclease PH [Synergistaceae bacterium]